MRVHKEGYPIILVFALLGFIIAEMSYLKLGATVPFYCVLFAVLFVLGFVVSFFRNPINRKPHIQDNAIIAPADGTIVTIEKVMESEYFKEERLQVSIFMSIYNVHKNFFPISGDISFYKHHNGAFLRAHLPKSSTENERSTIVVKSHDGYEVLFRQVAGAVARRIVSYVKQGQKVEQASEAGFIKFGSRIDIYLPLDADVKVKLNEKTVGSQTVIATL